MNATNIFIEEIISDVNFADKATNVSVIFCRNEEDMNIMGRAIYDQLKDCEDYQNGNIELNYESEPFRDSVILYRVVVIYYNNATVPVGFTMDPSILINKDREEK